MCDDAGKARRFARCGGGEGVGSSRSSPPSSLLFPFPFPFPLALPSLRGRKS